MYLLQELVALHTRFATQGLEVVAFPSDEVGLLLRSSMPTVVEYIETCFLDNFTLP